MLRIVVVMCEHVILLVSSFCYLFEYQYNGAASLKPSSHLLLNHFYLNFINSLILVTIKKVIQTLTSLVLLLTVWFIPNFIQQLKDII